MYKCTGESAIGRKDVATDLVIAFDSQRLRAICENVERAEQELGSLVAPVLLRRLADLRAATSPKDLVVGSPFVRLEAGMEYMVICLRGGFRIVFAPNHVENPRDGSGKVDWTRVGRIRITDISNGDTSG